MADEDREHRARLRKEYTRRKRILEIRKARQGDATDPAVDIELEEIAASLHLLDLADAPKASPEAQAAVGSENIIALAIAQLSKFGERLTEVEHKVDEGQNQTNVWREEHARAHQADIVERKRGQRLRLAAELGIVAVLGIIAQGAHVSYYVQSALILIAIVVASIIIARLVVRS